MNTEEDDEFARIEMESRIRQMTNHHVPEISKEIPFGIPFITQEELEQLLKEDDEVQTPSDT